MKRGASAPVERGESRDRVPEARPIAERVRSGLHGYTAAEQRVARALLDHYPVAGLETVARFANRAGTSGPTILRFVQRLGFASYAAFQNVLRSEVQSQLQSPLARYAAADDVARLIIMLLSDASPITGATLVVDGGYTI